jgi:hypothetical protein
VTSSGCARHKTDTSAAPVAGNASVATVAPSAAPASASPSALAPAATGILGVKLAAEARGRPTQTPKAEEVLAAVSATGVPLATPAQHLAQTIGAHFCIGATSPEGVAMSACEYDDDAAAKAGRDLSSKAFAAVQHRDITVNKKTTLTILQDPFDARSQAAHDKAVEAFRRM